MYASNLLTKETIVAVGDKIFLLNLESNNQLPDENLGVGESTWTCLHELEEEYDMKPFFDAVRGFMSAISKRCFRSFHLETLLKDLGVLEPDKTASYPVSTIIG